MMIPEHFNTNGLPPISAKLWLWIKTNEGELRRVRRTSIIPDKDKWIWPCETLEGHIQDFKVREWAYV